MALDVTAFFLSPLLGTLITVWLYGATCIQVHQYYNNFVLDTNKLKSFVAFIFALETAHVVLVSDCVYYYLIKHYGEAKYLTRSTPVTSVSVLIGFAIVWSVNQFFVHRIYALSQQNLWISMAVSFLVTVRLAFGITAIVFAMNYPEWDIFFARAQWIMTGGLATGVLADGLIAICISYYLLKSRSKVVVSTRNIINTLLKYTIQTGLILMIVASLELVTIVLWPHSLAFFGIFQVQVQLYANCFLTVLNARHVFRFTLEQNPMAALSSPQ